MFFAPRKPKTAVFTMFFASGSKNPRYLQCFLDNTEQKHWYLRNFRHDFPCKSHRTHVNYSVLGLILGFVTG